MDWFSVEFLSRAQFAVAAFLHWLFVPLALGLSLLIAVMQTRYYRGGDETYERAAKFWGRFYLLNLSLGVMTGLGLIFQLGASWPRFSAYSGGVIGPLLLIAGLAFFLAMAGGAFWHSGWGRLNKKLHLAAIWLAALAGNISLFWLVQANAWMQSPRPGISFMELGGTAELASLGALLGNPYGWGQFAHSLLGAWALAGFFMLGVSALRLFFPRRNPENQAACEADREIFRRSARLAAPFTLAALLGLALSGYLHAGSLAESQPAKLAAIGAHWESAANAPFYLLAWPDEENEGNLIEALPVPGGLSFLAHRSFAGNVQGLKGFPREDRPPLLVTFLSFRLMLGLAFLLLLLAGAAALCRNSLEKRRWLCRLLILSLPLPYLALAAGWTVAEAGRQPWIIYQVLRTAQAAPPAKLVGAGPVSCSLAAFCLIYAGLALGALYLMFKAAADGLDLRGRGAEVAASSGKDAA